ncbi:uncharacterized protein LOC120334944 [Styela clava]
MTSLIITSFFVAAILLGNVYGGSRPRKICMRLNSAVESVEIEENVELELLETLNEPNRTVGKGKRGRNRNERNEEIRLLNDRLKRFEERVEKIHWEIRMDVNDKYFGIEKKMNQMNERILTLAFKYDQMRMEILKAVGKCAVEYLGRCFYSHVHLERDVDFDDGRALCEADGAKAANIYSKQHLIDVMADVRPKTPASTYVWTGLQAYNKTGEVFLNDGKPAPYVKWWSSGFPGPGGYAVYLDVFFEATPITYQGMGNTTPTWKIHGVVCEI